MLPKHRLLKNGRILYRGLTITRNALRAPGSYGHWQAGEMLATTLEGLKLKIDRSLRQ